MKQVVLTIISMIENVFQKHNYFCNLSILCAYALRLVSSRNENHSFIGKIGKRHLGFLNIDGEANKVKWSRL